VTPWTRVIVDVAWGGLSRRLRPASEIKASLTCAVCKEPIRSIEDAWVEWLSDIEGSMRLVHHRSVTGTPENPDGCCHLETVKLRDHHLFRFAAVDGLDMLRALRGVGAEKIISLLYRKSTKGSTP
jgi:hypothetical protein